MPSRLTASYDPIRPHATAGAGTSARTPRCAARLRRPRRVARPLLIADILILLVVARVHTPRRAAA
jgi:hypothetical protein